jgi:hypothetical protein
VQLSSQETLDASKTQLSYEPVYDDRQYLAWYGLDIEDSREDRARTRQGDNFFTYDGVSIPFPEDNIDFIYLSSGV